MTDTERERLESRVLVLAPTGKDADLTQDILGRAGVECVGHDSLASICTELLAGAGALLLAEEAIEPERDPCLDDWLAAQPSWSDLPVLILARPGADSAGVAQSMDLFGNVTVLERPMRVAALVSAVRTALRARARQYQIREQLGALQTKEAELQLVTETTPLFLARCSRDLRYLFVNRAAATLLGREPKELVGRSIAEVIGEEALAPFLPHIERVLAGERVEFEAKLQLPAGPERWLRSTYLPDVDRQGGVVGWVSSTADVTQVKLAEEALREASRRKDEFLAILAHELRNPLAPIRNSLQILRMTGGHDPETGNLGEIMERQVNQMVRLVDDLMEVSRITRSKIVLRKEPVEAETMIRSALETSRPLLDEAGHELILSLPSEPLTLDGDPVRLTQIVSNLLNNAAKYTEGSGTIWLSLRREGGEAAISVRDTGTGIPADMLPRVFDLFTQVDRHSERARGGLGIGLTLVKSLVELHDGRVDAFSAGLGRGSEFVVRLPLSRDSVPNAAARPGLGASAPLSTHRILVVDDNRDAAESLGILLRMLGAEVRVAFSGPDALAELPSYHPSAIFLDIGMPGMDGHEVARRIRLQPELEGVLLIALTGWGKADDRQRSRKAGFDHHLVKPADLGALESLLTAAAPALRSM